MVSPCPSAVNGKRPQVLLPHTSVPEESYTAAHEENVRFVYEAWQEVEQQLDRGQRGESARGPVQYVEKTPNPRLKSEWGAWRGGGGAGSGGAHGRAVPSWGWGAILAGSRGLCWRAQASGTSGVSVLGWVGEPSTVRRGLAVGSCHHPRFCCGVLLSAALGTQDEGTARMGST
uniref:MAPK regulated corepressor interacting protein 2 n=1 Tax=Pavo cristatus TaxID=9049 RepID=A0A8C9EXK1_PAVCR